MVVKFFRGLANRLLQLLARVAPGARTVRVTLHRWRGVKIGRDVFIGYDAVLETSSPELITIGDGAVIGLRAVLIGHFREVRGVVIEENVYVGPGVIILPGVAVGRGAVITAGSVVMRSVPPMTVVQGNPARPVAMTTLVLTPESVSVKEFSINLKAIETNVPAGRKPGVPKDGPLPAKQSA